MSAYADALEEKKRKLAELRSKRQNRPKQEENAATSPRAAQPEPKAAESTYFSPTRPQQTQDLLASVQNLLERPAPAIFPPNDPKPGGGTATQAHSRRPVNLSVAPLVVDVDIPPKEVTTYEFGVQYPEDQVSTDLLKVEEEDRLRQEELQRERKNAERAQAEKEAKLQADREEEDRKRRELSAAQKKQILLSNEFKDFFSRSSVLIERALSQNDQYDITVDYRVSGANEKAKQGRQVLSRSAFFNDKGRTYNRPVTSMSWNPQYRELLLASYAQKEDVMSLEPDGLVLVWSTHMTQRPEYLFYCQSAVLTAQFHPSDPKLIIGGTQSGQIVIWDTREKSTPVNRTSLSYGHSHPLYSLSVVPSVNLLHNIISLSTDGRLCVWNDNDLVEPTNQVDLRAPKKKDEPASTTSAIANHMTTTCFGFPGRATNEVVLGSDEGALYRARIYDNPEVFEEIPAHTAPITAVRFHPIYKNSPKEISDLYLSSSFDWTVKLWSSKYNRALFTFESAQDYVYDVQWSPVHPALFAAGDGTGSIDFWDLNKSTEVPIHRTKVLGTNGQDENKTDIRERAVSVLKWSDDGKSIAVGSSDGSVSVFDVAPDVYKPTEDDASNFYEKMRKAGTDVPALSDLRSITNSLDDGGLEAGR